MGGWAHLKNHPVQQRTPGTRADRARRRGGHDCCLLMWTQRWRVYLHGLSVFARTHTHTIRVLREQRRERTSVFVHTNWHRVTARKAFGRIGNIAYPAGHDACFIQHECNTITLLIRRVLPRNANVITHAGGRGGLDWSNDVKVSWLVLSWKAKITKAKRSRVFTVEPCVLHAEICP